MSNARALATVWAKSDAHFFFDHPDRQSHIRNAYKTECLKEFLTLGPHVPNRERILLWRVPRDNPHWDPDHPQILKIPFLAFADEEIADRDDILLPILHGIMENAAHDF